MMLTSSRNLLEDGVVVVGLSVRWQYDASISQPASQSWPSLNQRCYHSLLSSIDVVLRPIVIGRLSGSGGLATDPTHVGRFGSQFLAIVAGRAL